MSGLSSHTRPAHSRPTKSPAMDLTQLLNFTLPPRQSRPPTSLPRRSRKTANSHVVWNKERFVNAQYRFVMDPTGDYTVHFADPDIYFQWHDIMQVIALRSSALPRAVFTSDAPAQVEGFMTCPICLSPPTAPRMTKCGHVYCFPCILQYLNMSDNRWVRCPICFDSVSEKQLKCVKWYDAPIAQDDKEGTPETSSSTVGNESAVTPRTGSILRMRLMQRPQITTLALPRSSTWPSDLIPPHQTPFHFLPDVFAFSKFMLATPSHLIADLTKDLDDLTCERRVMTDSLAASFIDAADQKIRYEIAKVAALDSSQLQELIEKAMHDQREIEMSATNQRRSDRQEPVPSEEVPTEFLAVRSQGISTHSSSQSGLLAPTSSAIQSRNAPKQRRNLNPPPPSTNTYYYYQAASGLPVFLHPLDIKILLSHFSSYSSFPDVISIRVEACSEGTVNDDLRKRCKYLAHLPEGADVVFIEADVSGVVGPEGIKSFENALKMRSTRRRDKGRKDDRAKARAEEREREKEKTHVTRPALSEATVEVPTGDSSEPFPPATQQQPQPQPSALTAGAWGTRSFASALHTPPPRPQARAVPTTRTEDIDYWDDVAWHELERSLDSGGRKRRGAKLVLGSGSGGRRR